MIEEQSTVCANIAYHLLEYIVAGLRQQIDSEQILYSNTRILFPIPKLYATNVGIIDRKRKIEFVQYEIQLQDSYMNLPDILEHIKPDLNLTVHMYDFRMNKEECLRYIENNIYPDRFLDYMLSENELFQYAISAACITYLQRAMKYPDKYLLPTNIKSTEQMIIELKNREMLVNLFSRKEVCDMTMAQFSRDDILRYGASEEKARDMTISLHRQGVPENIIANAANVNIEVVKEWIAEAENDVVIV